MEKPLVGIPHLFRCPISLDLFSDPVTLSTGQTYDRSCIEKWLADGNLTCPVTMQRLHDLSLIPNHALRHMIDQWLNMDAQFDLEHLQVIDPSLSMVTLKHYLQSQEVSFGTKLESLKKIKSLSEEFDSKRACLIQLGFFPLLLQLLFGNPSRKTKLSLEDSELAEEALNCVLNLSSVRNLYPLNMLKEPSNLSSLVFLLEQGSMKIKSSLCCLVEAISSSFETRDLCFIIGQNAGVLRGLVALLQEKSYLGIADLATRAVSGLCSVDSNRENVVQAGAINGLVAYLSNADRSNASRALVTIELLFGLESGKRDLISNPLAIPVIVKMVFRVSDHEGSEIAINLLLIICHNSSRIQEEAIDAGLLTQLLLLLQSQCSYQAKAKARLLLKVLRSTWDRDPSICNLQCGLVNS